MLYINVIQHTIKCYYSIAIVAAREILNNYCPISLPYDCTIRVSYAIMNHGSGS